MALEVKGQASYKDDNLVGGKVSCDSTEDALFMVVMP